MIKSLGKTGLTFLDPESNVGVKDLQLVVSVGGKPCAVQFDKATPVADGVDAVGRVGDTVLACRAQLRQVPGLNAVTVSHTLENPSDRPVRIAGVTLAQAGESSGVFLGKGGLLGMDLRYCHTDNVRTERYPHCQGEYPYVRAMPTRPVTAGIGEDQPFPAIYFTDKHYARGLVIAALSQDLTYQSFEFCKAPFMTQSIFSEFRIHHELAHADGHDIGSGATLALDGTFFQICERTHPQDAYVGYVNHLAGCLPLRGQKTPLLRQAFHCTWNYGVFAEQYEKDLLKTARFIRDNFPNIRFFLMDAGYVSKKGAEGGALASNFMDRFYPDINGEIDRDKMPHGIRHFSDEVRKLGLRPGIWWSPTARIDSRLYDDHPDWYLRNAEGQVYRIGEHNGFLDFSVPGAAEFLDGVLRTLVREWGMDALKMDFWSQNFEDRDARLRDPNLTALQSRRILFDTIRKYLPPDGVFMTCVAVGMGNPFIGLHADTYRNTIDIGAGAWEEQINNCMWALPTLGLEGRKTLLLNNDSFGFNLKCPDNENLFRMTWGFITMGMQEIGGRLEDLPERYVKAMRKFTDRCDRGYRCLCPDEAAFTGVPLPECLYVNYPPDSPTRRQGVAQSLAFFNWTDAPKMVSVRRAALGHAGPVEAVDFWSGAKESFRDEFITKRLNGRSALLFDVMG